MFRVFDRLMYMQGVHGEIHVERADCWSSRARGLLGRPPPPPGCALWIIPCRQVHTFGMAYTIDVVALDRGGVVLAIATLKPWRVGPWRWRAHSTLELAAGEASRLGVMLGDTPVLRERHRIDEKQTVR